MDEQRILEEMERKLAADDPRLASRLSAFGQPGLQSPFLSARARMISGMLALTLIAAVTLVLFVLSPFARQHYYAPKPHNSAKAPITQVTSGTTSHTSGGS
jgi:hypothetical protein